MEWPELPAVILALFGINVPDVVPLGFRFLPLLVKPRDVGLIPQVVPDLFHRYFVVGQVLSGEL